MVNTLTITGLPAATSLSGTDEFMVMQGGTTSKKGTVAQLTTAQAGVTALQEVGYSTVAAATAASVPTAVTALRTSGYAAAGDGGGARYKKVVSEPAHAGKIHSADGAWWEMAEPRANIRAFGADPTNTADCTTAINNAIAYAVTSTPDIPLYIPSGKYKVVTTPTSIPSDFTILGDGPRMSMLVPAMTDGTSCLKLVSSNEGITLKDFGISTYTNFATFVAGGTAPDCIGIEGSDISVGHTTRFYIENVYVYGCRTGVKIDGWIGTVLNLFITVCDLGLEGKELNGCMFNPYFENCRKSYAITNTFALTFLTLQDEGDISGTLAATVDTTHGMTFINPYWEAGTVYPRTEPYLTIGGTAVCQAISVTGAMVETINLPDGVPGIEVTRLDGGNFEMYLSVGSVGSGIGNAINLSAAAYNVSTSQANGLGTRNYQDLSRCMSPVYNYFPNPFFEVWLRGYDDITLANAALAQDTVTFRRGHNSVKVTASVGTANNYVEFMLPTLKLPVVSMYSLTFRVGAWIWIPDTTEYNDGTLAKIPDISIFWIDNAAAELQSTTTHPGTLAVGTWSFVYGQISIGSTVTKIGVRAWANRTANNASGNEIIYVDSISIVHASVPLEKQMRESFVNCEYTPSFESGQLRMLGNAVPTDANQTYSRGDQIFIQEPTPYMSPGWICTGAGAGGTAIWTQLAPGTGRGILADAPALDGATQAGARYFATNGRNSGEGAGAGTGCWCYLNSAGGWLADWSGVTATD